VAWSSDSSDTVISMYSATDTVARMTDPGARPNSAVRLRVGIVIDSRAPDGRASVCPATGPNNRQDRLIRPLSDEVGGIDQHAKRPTCGRQVPGARQDGRRITCR